MDEVQKSNLVQNLLELMDSRNNMPVSSMDQIKLKTQIGRAIDKAMVCSQDLDARRVTILLSDLRGFTSLAEKHTTLETGEALNRYFKRMSEIIIQHGGTIDKFMGDAIMALFGAPITRDDDIEAALACAIEMQTAMDEINQENVAHNMAHLYMGIGINTGDVMAGHLGSALHSEYTVIGDQVNLASRVMAHSLRGQILLGENTYVQAKSYIDIGDINEVKVKGKKTSVRMYELLAIHKPKKLTAPPRETRNSPRVDVDIPLSFHLLKDELVLPQEYVGQVIDMSYGGMRLISPIPIEPFSNIKITLFMSILNSDMTEIYAKVLRVENVNGAQECRIEFTSIDAKAALIIKEFVDGIIELIRG